MLEPNAVKVARSVLKGLEAGNGLRLLDGYDKKQMATGNKLHRGSKFAST